jgi:biotin carboxyl carrier protein
MSQPAHKIWVTVNGERFQVEVEDLSHRPLIAHVEGSRFEIEVDQEDHVPDNHDDVLQPGAAVHSIPAETSCDVTAPMPGDISTIHVKSGQVVQPGDPLCVLDAMKMKNTIHSPQTGTITEVCIGEGESVEYGVTLFKLG